MKILSKVHSFTHHSFILTSNYWVPVTMCQVHWEIKGEQEGQGPNSKDLHFNWSKRDDKQQTNK